MSQTEHLILGIVDVRHGGTEVVAVVLSLQYGFHLVAFHEQLLMSQEIVLQGREKQALPKPTGAAEEVNSSILDKVIHQGRLIQYPGRHIGLPLQGNRPLSSGKSGRKKIVFAAKLAKKKP